MSDNMHLCINFGKKIRMTMMDGTGGWSRMMEGGWSGWMEWIDGADEWNVWRGWMDEWMATIGGSMKGP